MSSLQEILSAVDTLVFTLASSRTKRLITNQVSFSVSADPLVLHEVYPESDSSVALLPQNDKKPKSQSFGL